MKRRNFLGSMFAAIGSLTWPSWLSQKPKKTVFHMTRFDYRPTDDRMRLTPWRVWQFGDIKDSRAIRAILDVRAKPGDEIVVDCIEFIGGIEHRRLGIVGHYRKSIDGLWTSLPVDDA